MRRRKSAFLSHYALLPTALLSCSLLVLLAIGPTGGDAADCSVGPDDDALIIAATNWTDESAMRRRMEAQAREKFSRHYHFDADAGAVVDAGGVITRFVEQQQHADETTRRSRRRKRDGGAVSMAVLSGVIGMTSRAVAELTAFHAPPSDGGCKWFGTAPLCNYHCPPDYDFIRSNNGRCSTLWLAGACVPDDSFGEPCSTILGSFFRKRFCCKSDPHECTWSGRWMGANTAHNIYCRYDNAVGRCGELSCSINHFDHKAQDRAEIGGQRCDEIHIFNLTGHATCGFISWRDPDNDVVNSWYKTNGYALYKH